MQWCSDLIVRLACGYVLVKIASNLCVFSPGSLTPAPHPSSSPSPPVASLSFPPQSRVESPQRRWTREKWALQHFDKTTANERFPNLPFFLGEKRQNNCKWQQSVQQFFDKPLLSCSSPGDVTKVWSWKEIENSDKFGALCCMNKITKEHCQRHNGPRVLSLIVLRQNQICIHFRYSQVVDSIAGSVVPPLELAANLATRWRLLHWLQI